MPTIFDRWATVEPMALTKIADVSIVRVVTEDDNEERITDASRVKELTLRFIWRQQPLKPKCFSIKFMAPDRLLTPQQAAEQEGRDPTIIPYDTGTDFVFRASAGAPGLAKARSFTINVNQVPTDEISDSSIGVWMPPGVGDGGGGYVKSMTNIQPYVDPSLENISGWYADTNHFINETQNGYLSDPSSFIRYDAYQREGMVLKQGTQRVYPLADNGYHPHYLHQYYSFSWSPGQRMARWADATMLWYTENYGNDPYIQQSQANSTFYQQSMNPTGYTILLYRQSMDMTFYGLRPNKKATYAPALPSSNGLLSATDVSKRGDFWEL